MSETTMAPCRRCLRETKHAVLSERKRSGQDDVEGVGEVYWSDGYEMLECRGCEIVSLRHTHWWSEGEDDTVTYFPPAVSRPMPRWRYEVPHRIAELMGEVYTALNADCRSLALMGVRTLVDLLLVNKIGDVGTFAAKLQELENQKFISEHSRKILEAAVDAGNAAAHRGHKPTPQELNQVMDIVENLLQSVYIFPKAAATIASSTPPRKVKGKP